MILPLALAAVVFFACPPAELTSARVYLQEENYEKAEEFLLKTMEVAPELAEAPALLGSEIFGRRSKWSKMNEMFDKAISINPEEKLTNGMTVRQHVDNARNVHWTNAYNKGGIIYNQATALKAGERKTTIESALKEFELARTINPHEPLTYPILSTCYFELHDTVKTIESLTKALELAPDDLNSNQTAGQVFLRLGDNEKSVKYLSRAVELDPSNTTIIRQLATVYYDLGQVENSLRTFKDAISKETDKKVKADLYFNLGVLNMQMEDFDEAEDNFFWAHDLNPDDEEALLGMAQTFEKAERWRKAEKFYRELIDQNPDNPEYYKGIARVLMKRGRPEQAARFFEKSKQVGN